MPAWKSYNHQIVNSASILFFFWNSWFLSQLLRMVLHSFLIFPVWENWEKVWHAPRSVHFDIFLLLIINSIKFSFLLCHYVWNIQHFLAFARALKICPQLIFPKCQCIILRKRCFLRCDHLKNKARTITFYCLGVE